MKAKRFTLILIALLLLGFFQQASLLAQEDCPCPSDEMIYAPDKCTVVIVGRKASTDGSVITTHTSDCGVCDWSWRYVPPADHEPGSKRNIYWFPQFFTQPPSQGYHWSQYEHKLNGLEIDQVPHTYGYLHGMFGYINDNQVAIGESTIGCARKLRNNTPTAKMDITMLTLLAMERATTAREAIQIMGDLACKYGYGNTDSGEMLALSDPKEVWVFEIIPVGPLWAPETGKPGAVWCAQRVPDDHVSVCPNESRIGEIDLNDDKNFMASENVITCAIDMKLYDPDSGEPFNWKRAYSPTEANASGTNGSRGRMWRFFDLVAPSQRFSPDTPNMDFPFSIKPEKKYSVKDVIDMLRDNFEGTPFYTARGLQGGPFQNPNHLPYGFELDGETYRMPRSMGMNRSEYSTVIQVRDWLPNPIGGLVWISFGSQNTNCFMPFYQGVTRIPESFTFGDHWHFDRDVARWAFDYVDFHTYVMYMHAIQDVRAAQDEWELSALERTEEIDTKAKKLYKDSPEKAAAFLNEYCNNNAELVVDAWWKLGDDLLVKYNHLWIYDVEERSRNRPEYPEEWLRALVKYNNLKPVKGRDQ